MDRETVEYLDGKFECVFEKIDDLREHQSQMRSDIASQRSVCKVNVSHFEKEIEKARARAEKLAKQTWNDTLKLLPATQRKAVKKATAQIEKATQDLQKRGERAVKDINKSGQKLVTEMERRAAQAVKPVVDRLDVATRSDIDRLSKRLAQIERKLKAA